MKLGKVCSVSQTALMTRPASALRGSPDADRDADDDAQDGGAGDEVERQHQRRPEAGDHQEAQESDGQQSEPPAAEMIADRRRHADHHRPGQPQIEIAQRQQHPDGDVVAHRLHIGKKIARYPAHAVIDRRAIGERHILGQHCQGREEPRQHDRGGEQRQKESEMAVARDPGRAGIDARGDPAHIGLGHAVEHDGDERDGDALLDRLADLQLLQREQQFLAEARGADERGDDRHGECLHHDLVEPQKQGPLGGRQLDLPQELGAACSPTSAPPRQCRCGTVRMPRMVQRAMGGRAKISVASMAGTWPKPNRTTTGPR